MVLSVLLKFLYPPPASVVITAMSVISFVSMSNAGWTEMKGKHMQYSKLRSAAGDGDEKKKEKAEVSSKVGMIVLYTPAFLAGVSSFFIFPLSDFRFNLLRSAVTTHFFKRVFEVLFVHKYSGSMDVEAMITISLSYCLSSATMIYSQHLAQPLPEPAVDLKYVGIPMFLLGIGGNLYHHYLLSKLRSEGEKQYKIPQGGLFSLVICPHYLFEILGFFGISCISQTVYAFSFTLGTTFYLMGRSYATRKWYESKFEDFPEDVKALIPYVF
ncbi:UNVERIFIED_CONTAM: Polyprenol reductase 1 [Sesamum angustifolium]|uniref:Polyprenol reductase 1 n=2 Tax=Sesamum TaxID=4181 RepID=A0AAW2PTS4_9LAMI